MLTRGLDIPLAFLNLILPERGFLIAAIKNPRGRGFIHIFASTHEQLWAIIEEADQDGQATYHACASFVEPRSDPRGTPSGEKRLGRTKHNVLGAKAFWLDMDVGPGKGYSDQDAAIDALKIFCTTLNLPPPIIVSSGGGLHVYWSLQQMLDRATWERYARGLKNLCFQYDLRVDPARTADISSVLRTPGTHNRKYGTEREVELDPKFLDMFPDTQGYALEQLKVFAEHTDAPRRAPKKKQHDEDAERARFDPNGLLEADKLRDLSYLAAPNRRQISAAALSGLVEMDDTYPPSSGELVAERCEQVRALRDGQGKMEEPLWYAALGVLAFCAGGDELAHKWSSGDEDRYTEQETQERLDRARQFGPTTCEKFHELNPTVCERCPHWGTGKFKSPIVLGRQEEQPTPVEQVLPHWERTQGGALKPKSYINARIMLGQLDIRFKHDVFHDKKIVEGGGDAVEKLGSQLSDAMIRALRDAIIKRFGYDPGAEATRDAAERACEENRYDPVLDYLTALRWDGQPRLDCFAVTYLGAEDTPLNRAIGRKLWIALVARARHPGIKFDYVIVLEGPQGSQKSSALSLIVGDDNFSDVPILHLQTRAQQEAMQGKWLIELSELAGMRRTDIETIKSFISRQHDDARPAYGHFRVDQARRCIFVGTTNDDRYLRDTTGNRRFWPLKTSQIDLDALRRDRNQLFAEAAHYEAQGENLVIARELWPAVEKVQDERRMQDPWKDKLADVQGKVVKSETGNAWEERISTTELMDRYLGLPSSHQGDAVAKRLASNMRELGWHGSKAMKFKERTLDSERTITRNGYWRPAKEPSKKDNSTNARC
jgi:hypothetical protein